MAALWAKASVYGCPVVRVGGAAVTRFDQLERRADRRMFTRDCYYAARLFAPRAIHRRAQRVFIALRFRQRLRLLASSGGAGGGRRATLIGYVKFFWKCLYYISSKLYYK